MSHIKALLCPEERGNLGTLFRSWAPFAAYRSDDDVCTLADVLVLLPVSVSGSDVPGDVPGAPLQRPDCAHHR